MGVALIVDIGLGSLAYLVGDIEMASICSILAASLVGILIFNFPLGKIFLGDGGRLFCWAYSGLDCPLVAKSKL